MTDSSPSTSPPAGINRYGAMAWEHWERYRPSTLATIADPISFFRELGSFIEAEVTAETSLRLSPKDATDPTRVAQIRQGVEEELLAAHILLPAETDPAEDPATDPDLIESFDIALDSPLVGRLRQSPLIEPDNPPPPKS